MKRLVLTTIALIITAFVILFMGLSKEDKKQRTDISPEKKIIIAGQEVVVEVVDTPSEIELGLSGKEVLYENSGMFFDLGERRVAVFWMRDMKFPLDIIWIDGNKIVGIEENAPIPLTGETTPSFTSPQPVTHVLEVNAGFTKKHNVQIGGTIEVRSLNK